ncbi:hypothetical protein Ddye_000079 [Dipteronia dyeriana]|uniref:Uncharacterized protein n=1 Tax=Dipteronia dyeriana TaxID=168575 RepID=A0AAD9XLM5_9ROSI|nr:hypothetical protein Ddye_000079 [Dipteronia dyeriana]
MNEDVNTLVLLDEFGGNPSLVSFKTVVVGTACRKAYENKTLELSCQGRPIAGVLFVSFGNLRGSCASFTKVTCYAQENVLPIIRKGGEPQEALLRGRSLAPLHSLQGSKPFFNMGDNERVRDGRDRTRE